MVMVVVSFTPMAALLLGKEPTRISTSIKANIFPVLNL
jgi:hypothetical protein